MLNRSASLAMPTSILESLPGKLDIKIGSPSMLYILMLILFKHLILSFFDVINVSFLRSNRRNVLLLLLSIVFYTIFEADKDRLQNIFNNP